MNYFHFYGRQSQNKTITQIVAKNVTTCKFLLFLCSSKNVLEPLFSAGDGTVPEISAVRKSGSLNLNAPNAKVFRVTNKNDHLADHADMLQNPDVQSALLTLLNGGTVSLPTASVPTRTSASRGFAHHTQSNDSALSYYVSVVGGSSVVVTDDKDHSTAVIGGDLKGSVPGVDTFSMGTNAEMIVLPVSSAEQHSISFTTTDEPLLLRVVKGESNVSPTNVIQYQDLALPAGVSAKLLVSRAGVENLRYDSDGNGTYDASVSPTMVLSGGAALDITAPTLTFAESKENPTTTQVTIAAGRCRYGVLNVQYSTEGVHFQTYTSALVVNSTQTSSISLLSRPIKPGNRSPIISYSLGSPGCYFPG